MFLDFLATSVQPLPLSSRGGRATDGHNGHYSQGAPETQDLFAFAPLNLCGVMSNLRQPQAKVAMSLEVWKAGRASHQADLDSDRRHTLGSSCL